MDTPTVIGIDLGTTNSLVSFWDGGQARLIPNAHGDYLTPSVVGFDEDGRLLVGEVARNRLVTHPARTAALFKRYMGSDKLYDLGQPSRRYRPEELSSFVLRALKADAEAFLGVPVTEAVISVPAYFNDRQRNATRMAGELAGLKVERLINEPTAAALSYGLHRRAPESSFLVFDLGGGTFDVSVLTLFDGIMEVNASVGNNRLGGEDFLDALVKAFEQDCQPGTLPPAELSRLRWHLQQAKLALSSSHDTSIGLQLGGKRHDWSIDRKRFEQLSAPLLAELRRPVERALADAAISPAALDAVILAGGATRMPMVRNLAGRLFGQLPQSHLDPDQIVALGAAVQAGLKQRSAGLEEVVLTDVAPFTLGVETTRQLSSGRYSDGHFTPIIERNTIVPVSRVERFRPLSEDQDRVNIQIYQGESRYVSDNVLLGELLFELGDCGNEEPAVDVRFTYDINGMLQVSVSNSANGRSEELLIINRENHLSEQELRERLAELSELMIHPREQAENRLLLARGERLYEQMSGRQRERIAQLLAEFEAVLQGQQPEQIRTALADIGQALDRIEQDVR